MYCSYQLNIWDVGGQKSLRSYWRNYFESTDGLVWVVDAVDRRRMADCKTELHSLLKEEVMTLHLLFNLPIEKKNAFLNCTETCRSDSFGVCKQTGSARCDDGRRDQTAARFGLDWNAPLAHRRLQRHERRPFTRRNRLDRLRHKCKNLYLFFRLTCQFNSNSI